MTNTTDGPGKGPGKPQVDPSAAKKPAPIIDLKATEIAAGAAAKSGEGAKPTSVPPVAKPADAKDAKDPKAAGPSSTATSTPGASGVPSSKPAASTTGPATASTATSGAARPQAATSAPAPVAARGGSGNILTHGLAGIVGGFLALLGADTIGPQLGLRAPAADATGELTNRLAALEQASKARTTSLPTDVAQRLAATDSRLARIDDLTKSIAALGEGQAKLSGEQRALVEKLGKGGEDPAAADRLAKIEDKFNALATAAANDTDKGRIAQLAAITGQIKDLEATLANQLGALRKSVAKDIETRVAQATEVSEAARSGTQRIDRELSAIKTEAATIGQRAEALKNEDERLGAAMRQTQQDVGALKTTFDTLRVEVANGLKAAARPADVSSAIAPITTKLASVEQNLQGVVRGEEDRRANAERIVLALELGNLKRALDRGGRYAPELAEVQKASGGKLDIAALERFKDRGVPSLADLTREFREVAHAMIDAEREPTDAGVVDKLLSGARSIVRVRKVDHVADDKSTEAIAARIEGMLKDGRLVDVIEETKKLSAKAAAPAKDWIGRVEGRAAIDRAVGQIETQLKASLGGKAPEKVIK